MDPVLIALVLALVVSVVTGGSPVRLVRRRWRWVLVGAAGLLGQVVLATGVVPADRGHDLGAGLLVSSLLLLAGFAAANLVRTGMGVVLVGLACLLVATALNHGMPVDVPDGVDATEAPYAPTATNRPRAPGDRVFVLTDVITITQPVPLSLSFGVLVFTVGLVDVAVHASRRVRRVHRPARAAADTDFVAPYVVARTPTRPSPDPSRRPAPADLVRPVPRVPREDAARPATAPPTSLPRR